MYVQVVTFRLGGIDETQYHEACKAETEPFATLPGLLAKIWLRDPAGGIYGGLYLWRDREAHDAYVAGPIFDSIVKAPAFADVASKGFDVFDDLTKATQPGLSLV
ncbi:MAG TPA: YdhR family protein [Actinomycetota bacterium]|nr:YdhR family protein [Actinomycetota bacterium]